MRGRERLPGLGRNTGTVPGGASPVGITASAKLLGGRVAACRARLWGRALGGPFSLAATAASVPGDRAWVPRAQGRATCAGGSFPRGITASMVLLGGRVAACRARLWGRALGGPFSLAVTAASVRMVGWGASRGWFGRVREAPGAWPSDRCATPAPRGRVDGSAAGCGGRPHDSSRIRPPGARARAWFGPGPCGWGGRASGRAFFLCPAPGLERCPGGARAAAGCPPAGMVQERVCRQETKVQTCESLTTQRREQCGEQCSP